MTDRDELTAFARGVRRMRDAQKRYFRTRDPADLEAGKAAEREVDKAVDRVLLFGTPSLFEQLGYDRPDTGADV